MIIKEQDNKIVYSDGDETERRMLDIAREYPEDASQDYIADNSSYTINNTFSSVRQNILNWYPFHENASILEVGAGMGAITGMLCDKAANVTAIEMNQVRADVIRARYKNRNNLEVISDNINDWNTEKRFDYVVFIGVLEYAAIFTDSKRPYDEFLLSVKRLLKPNGKVLFAIENRFGLKYWLGASEDHLQKPFVGVAGYKEPKTARTFSKKELETILERVGLLHYRFYSVLPDYKFPELIFSDDYVPDYMNLQKVSFTYSKNSALIANEKELYKDIIENGTFSFFANSFLVEASAETLDDRYIMHVSAKGEVYKEFRVSTVIDNMNHVYKMPMHENAKIHINNILKNTTYLLERGISILPVEKKNDSIYSEKYVGVGAQKVFQDALEKNDVSMLHHLIDSLKENLLKSSETVEYNINNIILKNNLGDNNVDYGRILQKAFVDMTFYNAFWENGRLVFFDQEWCFDRVPLKFCLYYSIKSAYQKADVDTNIELQELLRYVGIKEEEVETYDRLEEFIWSNVLYRQTDFYGAEGYCNRYAKELTAEEQMRQQNERQLETEKRYQDKMAELVQAREQLVYANTELADKNTELADKNTELTTKNAELIAKNYELAVKNKELTSEKFTLEEKEKELIQEVKNKEGHIELLLEVEREYEREKHSKTYRMAMVFRKISIALLPVNSKRRFFARVIAKGVRHPILTLKMINPRRIKNCFIILRKEGVASALNHYRLVEEYERSRSVPLAQEKLEVVQVAKKEKSIEEYPKLVFEQVEKPCVSIVIPVYNQFDYTYHCLESVLNNSCDCTYEVIIGNDCSTDLTTRLSEVVSGIRIINSEKNLRFLLNCNNAAKYARGEYILFLNNDTQVQNDWLRPLVNLMENHPSVGMVGSKLLYADGYLQEAGGILWKDGSAWNYGNRQNPNDSEYNYVKEVDYISGAAIMIRASLWKEIGGFDERFAPAYCEDSDLAFEVRKHGYQVMYQPKSVVVHFEGVSNGTDLSSGQKKYQVDNQKKFLEKWENELQRKHFENGTNVFLARERSKDKKHVLVIDHYVPQYDKDAGSKTTFMYLKMLVNKGYKITFLGDNFYQHEPYTTELQQMGIFVMYGPKYAENWKEWLNENIQYFDIFYLNRPHITVKYIDFIKEHGRGKIIYYGHDLHFLRIHREYELNGDPKLLEESENWKNQEFSIMRKADMNYYPSVIEEDAIHAIDAQIPVKAITAYVYEQFKDVVYNMDARQGILFVGGFGHTPNLDAVLWFLDKIFPEVYRRVKAPFYIVGSKAPEEITQITTEGVVVKGFVSEEELQELYQNSRMAVVPLRYGAGVKGKVVEALYYGIPIVTTSVGAEGIEGIENIAIVKDKEQELIDAICDAYGNSETLTHMSETSQKFVREKFGTNAVWSIIKEDFE